MCMTGIKTRMPLVGDFSLILYGGILRLCKRLTDKEKSVVRQMQP